MNYTITHQETGITYSVSTEDIRKVANILPMNSEELADMMTGLNCDSYADMTEEYIQEVADMYDDVTLATDKFMNSEDERVQTTYAYYRIMNSDNSDEVCEHYWRDDALAMITDYHEDKWNDTDSIG